MKKKNSIFLILFVLLQLNVFSLELKKVSIQLKWMHQFQFAGYYMAKEKGFFKDVGVDVELIECKDDMDPLDQVLSGKAQFGVGSSSLIIDYQNGKPITMLCAILQHSPDVFVVRKDSGIRTFSDLVGKKVMTISGSENAVFLSAFMNEGINPDSVNMIVSSMNVDDLIDGKTDAYKSYITNEPFYLRQKGVEPFIINPIAYGVDYYGDIFYTTKDIVDKDPKLVKNIKNAVIKGWEYALKNKKESIDIILNKYKSAKSKKHLEFEADEIEKLILPNFIEIGHMNLGRWNYMLKSYEKLGLVTINRDLDEFIFDENRYENQIFYNHVKIVLIISIIVIILAIILTLAFNKKMRIILAEKSKKIQRNENYFRNIFNALNDAVFVINNENGSIYDVNEKVIEMYGYRNKLEVLNCDMSTLSLGKYPYDDRRIKEFIENPEEIPLAIQWHAQKKDGELFWLEFSIKKMDIDDESFLIIVGRDITVRKKTQELMIQTEKMLSVGGLAAGMAHEINNPLSGVVQGIQNLKRRFDPDFEKNMDAGNKIGLDLEIMKKYMKDRNIFRFIEGINESAIRASSIVRDMLEFSKKSNNLKKSYNLNGLIDKVLELVKNDYDINNNVDFKRINIIRDYKENIEVYIAYQEIEQVIFNIIKNASQALNEISMENPEIKIILYKNKHYAVIRIKNNGPFIEENIKKRIFDPFFTTKKHNFSTGLGLAVSYFIVTENHNGIIYVNSSQDNGVEFVIKLPLLEDNK